MKRHEILYHPTFTATPLSFWVHRHLDEDVAWVSSRTFDPPLPKPVPALGWPMLKVEFNGLELYFASAQELHHFMRVISQNPMPTSTQLSKMRGTTLGPNQHWLSRLPAKAKSAKMRKVLFEYLVKIAPEFVAVG